MIHLLFPFFDLSNFNFNFYLLSDFCVLKNVPISNAYKTKLKEFDF